MKTISFEVKVGMFILIAVIILLGMIFSIGEIYFIRPGYHIKVLFNFANGIALNSPVRLAGIEVGEVDSIDIYYDSGENRTRVELSAWIKSKEYRIEEDSKAVINTLGLLGEKYLEIFPGTSEKTLDEGSVLVGVDPISTENMAMELMELLDSFKVIAKRLEKGEGTIGRFLTDESIYENIEAFTEDIKQNPWKLMNKPKGE